MFLHLSVILFTWGRGLPKCMLGYTPGSRPPRSRHPPGNRRLLLGTIRILLECILVSHESRFKCWICTTRNLKFESIAIGSSSRIAILYFSNVEFPAVLCLNLKTESTRKHTSRMPTARSNGHLFRKVVSARRCLPLGCLPRGYLPEGLSAQGVSALGVVCPGNVSAQGGVCLGGVYLGSACPGGCLPRDVCVQGVYTSQRQTPPNPKVHTPWYHPSPLNRMTDKCKNITFPQFRLRGVQKQLNSLLIDDFRF